MSSPVDCPRVDSGRLSRSAWFTFGWLSVGLGGAGIVLPVVPTTPFFLLAAYSFSRSSPRFEAWILSLPGVGPLVCDYRNGLGVARSVKISAIAMMSVMGTGSALLLATKSLWLSAMVVALCVVGSLYVALAVPGRRA